MNILKRLFCKHTYEYYGTGIMTCKEPDFGGGGYNSWEERYTEYVCTKCGKRKKVFD